MGPIFAPSVEAARLQLVAAIRAPNTVTAHSQAWKNFRARCDGQCLPALPSNPEVVAAFAVELAMARGLRPSTAALHVAAITYFHRQAGLAPPVDSSVHHLLQGAKRIGAEPCGKAALSVDQSRRMVAMTPPTTRGLRDRAILLVGFATASRRSNLSALDVGDVDFRPQGLAVRAARQKNNQVGAARLRPSCAAGFGLKTWPGRCSNSSPASPAFRTQMPSRL